MNNELLWYFKGRRDCRDGVPHESGKCEAYDEGYSVQYEFEQIIGNQTWI